MRLDDNRSVWVAEQPPYEALPPLGATESADVAIVGGGLTGVSTAWHLSRRFPSRRIVLLEAKTLANGASGRNGGQLLSGVNGMEALPLPLVGRLHDVTRRGIDRVEEMVRAHGLDCGFSRRGCLQIFTQASTAEAAHARVERWRDAGVPVEWLSGASLGLSAATGAVLDRAAGSFNGVGFLRGLRSVLVERGVAVWEQTPVLAIEEGRTLRLTTPAGEVRAGALVLATNAYTPSLGYFRDSVLPLHSHVVATRPIADEKWAALGWAAHDGFSDDHDRIAFGCRTAQRRLVFGGGGNESYAYRYGGAPVFADAPSRTRRSFDAIERRMLGYFPSLAGVALEHRWTGTIALTLDRGCAMGVRGGHRNVFYALGYSGHGLALAMLAGEVICDLYADNHEPWRDLPFYRTKPPRLPPEPLRWLGYQLYTRLTGRSPRRT